MQERRKQEIIKAAYSVPLRCLNILSFYGNNLIQLMHSTMVNIRFCQPQKVMFTEAKPGLEVNITFTS